MVNEVTIVEGLKSKVLELKISVELESLPKLLEVKLKELRFHTLYGNRFLQAVLEVLLMSLLKL